MAHSTKMNSLEAIDRELPTWPLNRDELSWSNRSGAADMAHSTEMNSLEAIDRELPTWRTQPR